MSNYSPELLNDLIYKLQTNKNKPMISIHFEKSITFIETSPYHSIGSLKSMIQSQKSIPIQSIKLIFQGKLLQNNLTLQDYNIVPGSALVLIRSPEIMQVIVKLFGGRSYTFDVWPHDSFQDLKEKIQNKVKIPISNQRFFISDHNFEDSDLIFNSGIQNLAIIGLMFSVDIQISVINERNEILKVCILNDKKIRDFKRLIEKFVKIDYKKMFISCKGKKLNDDDFVSILDKKKVFVCREKNKQAHVKFSDGEIRTVHCDDEISIRGLIKELKKMNPSCRKECLKIDGEFVEDESKKICEISNEKIFNVEITNIINISTSDSASNALSVLNPNDINLL